MNIMKSITIVFPAYNEEDIIVSTIDRAVDYLSKTEYNWDILIVNNCSTDNTGRIIDEMAKKNKRISVIHHPSNLGYIASLNTGLKKGKGDIIFIVDSDGQHTVEDVGQYIARIDEGYDVVFGWKKKRYDPLMRLIMTRMLNFSSKVLLGSPLHDINCGFRAFTKKAARKIEMKVKGNVVGPAVFVSAVSNGLKYTEVAVRHFPRTTGKGFVVLSKLPKLFFGSYAMLFRLRSELKRNTSGRAR